MLKRLFGKYCYFLDVRLKNTTLVVLSIGCLVAGIGSMFSDDISNGTYLQANMSRDSFSQNEDSNMVRINGVLYKISLEEIQSP